MWLGSAGPPALSAIAVHFDLAKGEMPENIALAPDRTAYVLRAAYTTAAAPNLMLATLPRR